MRVQQYDDTAEAALTLEDAVIALASSSSFPTQPQRATSPVLAALKEAGTRHVYVDSAATDAIAEVALDAEGAVLEAVDGNTINQPLLADVLDRWLEDADVAAWVAALRRQAPDLPDDELRPLLYGVLLARVGGAIVKRFAGSRTWQASLQLHMDGVGDVERSVRWGRLLRSTVPSACVKVPFAPHAPECFLVARDLQAKRIPVNFTSTFSARQVAAAALLGGVDRTNVFLGRIDAGLGAERAGAHTSLAAQRLLHELRREHGLPTQLIVASLRSDAAIVDTAGCDVYTVPPDVLRSLLDRTDIEPGALESRLETSYADRLGLDAGDDGRPGPDPERVGRLFEVEPELVEFLRDYGASDDFRDTSEGEAVARRFEEAGFGDFFASPSEAEWKELAGSKLPDPASPVPGECALDTEYALRADADFSAHQERIDARIAEAAGR